MCQRRRFVLSLLRRFVHNNCSVIVVWDDGVLVLVASASWGDEVVVKGTDISGIDDSHHAPKALLEYGGGKLREIDAARKNHVGSRSSKHEKF